MFKKISKLLDKVPKIGETAEESNPTAHIHFFNILGRGDWYVTEMKEEGNDFLMFGYVKSPLGEDCDEFGYFTLNQLIDTNKSLGFDAIELDRWFEPCKIKELLS